MIQVPHFCVLSPQIVSCTFQSAPVLVERMSYTEGSEPRWVNFCGWLIVGLFVFPVIDSKVDFPDRLSKRQSIKQ